MHPHIEIKASSISTNRNYNDPDYDDTKIKLFHVIISEGKLKLLMTVQWQDPANHTREFQVIRHDHLYLDGHDPGTPYPGAAPYTGNISADTTEAQELFQKSLSPYMIHLDKVTVHSKINYESTQFSFTDPQILEELYDRINDVFLKAKYSPASLA